MKSSLEFIICLIMGTVIIFHRVSHCRDVTQCAGSEINLNCSSPDWLIQVDYEIYAYNQSQGCDVSADSCQGVEFLDVPSVRYCNGRPSCSFRVPTDQYLSVCRENATSLKVLYQCVAKSQSFDLCTDFLERHRSTVYLTSPQYPSPKLSPVKCSCEVKGQNISVHTLEQTKAPLSSVVYIMSIESLTKHITKLQIINRLEFSNISGLWVFLDNRFPEQEFRLWLKLTGTDMTVKCGSPVITSVVSSLDIVTATHLSYLPSSILTASEMDHFSTQEVNWTSLPNMHWKSTGTASLDGSETAASPDNSETVESQTATSLDESKTSYLSLYTASATATVSLSSVSITGQSTRRISQSDEVILIAVISTVCGLLFIIFIIATILICRKRTDEASESREHIHRPGTNVIHAYEDDNFTVNF